LRGNSWDKRAILALASVVIAAFGVIFSGLQYIDSHNSRDVKENPAVNNSFIVNLPNYPKENIISRSEIGLNNDNAALVIFASDTIENTQKVNSNIEESKKSVTSVSNSKTLQHSIATNEDVTDNNKIAGIGDYISGLGYRLTNEYISDGLKSACSPRSVQAYCNSSDSCVDCDGSCIPSGISKIKNGVTSTCSNGKWTRSENIGEYVLGLGYRRTNEYMSNSLKSTCSPRSVQAYCNSSDSCVDCDGNCIPSGISKIKNGVTSKCSNGKWTRY
jgi:hypothetical protein